MNTIKCTLARQAAVLALLCCTWALAQAAAVITIVNNNAPNEGFNDPAPVAPVGGNTGTTLGQQRLIAFQHAADIWGATITSKVAIRIGTSFVELPCTENSAVLGSAGPNDIFADFPNAPKANTWYPSALASKLAGKDQAPEGEPHIRARFNSRLGLFPDCLPGSGFYLGVDRKHGTQIDLVAVLLHEMAHGLGFQSFTDEETGEQYENKPSIWDHFLVDTRSNKLWGEHERRRTARVGGGRRRAVVERPQRQVGGTAGAGTAVDPVRQRAGLGQGKRESRSRRRIVRAAAGPRRRCAGN